MTIKQLALSTDVSLGMIRHYEKIGLLDDRHVTRLENTYRRYNDLALERVNLIQLAQFAGFSLKELQTGLDDWENDTISLKDKVTILKNHLESVGKKIERLQQSRLYILSKLAKIEE